MEEEISKIKLSRNEDPETIVDKLAAIQVQYGAILSDEKRAAVVIKAGRANYASTITALCRLMQKTEKRDPTMSELIQDMQSEWRISDKGKKGNGDNEANETALANAGSDKKALSKKKCYLCHKKGHLAKDCPSPNNNGGKSNGGFKGNCNNCGKKGQIGRAHV